MSEKHPRMNYEYYELDLQDHCDELFTGWPSEIFIDAMFEDPNDYCNNQE